MGRGHRAGPCRARPFASAGSAWEWSALVAFGLALGGAFAALVREHAAGAHGTAGLVDGLLGWLVQGPAIGAGRVVVLGRLGLGRVHGGLAVVRQAGLFVRPGLVL